MTNRIIRCFSRFALFIALAGALAIPAHASEITTNQGVITISGDIGSDDFKQFNTKASALSGRQVIVLESNGGSVLAAIDIGQFVRLRGWETAVPTYCYSACALIWLAGSTKTMSSSAKIGLHAASLNGRETGEGNALIGAYLTKLGYDYDVVAFATIASPDNISLLTQDTAKKLSIDVSVIERPVQQPVAPQPPLTPSPAGVKYATQHLTRTGTLEEAVADFTKRIIDQYNQTNIVPPDTYADAVAYYRKSLTKAAIIDDKKRFGARWTYRFYRPSEMTVACQDERTCMVVWLLGLGGGQHKKAHRRHLDVLLYPHQKLRWPFVVTSENSSVTSRREVTADEDASCKPQTLGCKVLDR